VTLPSRRLPGRVSVARVGQEFAKFGIVGAAGLVVVVGVFNLLRSGLDVAPVPAKVIATSLAMLVAYAGNRYWTWRDRDRRRMTHDSVLFFLFNGIALLIETSCLAVSHYVLDLDSVLADNVSGNGIGFALGTAFRFWSYRRWVFPESGPSGNILDPHGAGQRAIWQTSTWPSENAGLTRAAAREIPS
jgi:putative flippase GtrA